MSGVDDEVPWWRDRLTIASGIVFAAWCVLALTWPLSGDAAVFGWIADTVVRGGAPYVDAWDTKGPSAWLPSLLVQGVVGRTSWGIRLFDIVMVLCGVCAIRAVARRLGQHGSGRVAVALYLLWYASLDFWQSAQPDGWTATWLVGACALALTATSLGALAAGLLVGVATMLKPFYVGYALVIWLIVGSEPQQSTRTRATRIALVTCGIAITITVMLLLLQHWGGLAAYWDVQRWNRDVYARLGDPWMTRIPAGIRGMLVVPWGVVVPVALFAVLRQPRALSRRMLALAIGLAGAVAGVMLQGKGWVYHWLPMLPFLALLADFGFAALRREVAGETAAQFRRIALVMALSVAALSPLQQLYRFARSRRSDAAVAAFEHHEFRYYGRHPGSASAIIDSLARIEPGAARIMLWAMHPAPFLMNGLELTTPFAVIRPLYDGPGSSYRARYRRQFEQSVVSAPPRWWLLPTASLAAREPELHRYDVQEMPAIALLLREQYRQVGETEEWRILERVRPIEASTSARQREPRQ
ncbi:MAG TPA: hypothetical protein VE861_16525 [Gemmatimonadaceae bacterium]|nr:hypothetical protein [Gemmatimonadaceae bacterium]